MLKALSKSVDGNLLSEQMELTSHRTSWRDGGKRVQGLYRSKRFVCHESVLARILQWYGQHSGIISIPNVPDADFVALLFHDSFGVLHSASVSWDTAKVYCLVAYILFRLFYFVFCLLSSFHFFSFLLSLCFFSSCRAHTFSFYLNWASSSSLFHYHLLLLLLFFFLLMNSVFFWCPFRTFQGQRVNKA